MKCFRGGMIQNYHLSIGGGGVSFTYSMSGSWLFKQGRHHNGFGLQPLHRPPQHLLSGAPWLKVGENISFMASGFGTERTARTATTAKVRRQYHYPRLSAMAPLGSDTLSRRNGQPSGQGHERRYIGRFKLQERDQPLQHDRILPSQITQRALGGQRIR